jgi:hypothetical protein
VIAIIALVIEYWEWIVTILAGWVFIRLTIVLLENMEQKRKKEEAELRAQQRAKQWAIEEEKRRKEWAIEEEKRRKRQIELEKENRIKLRDQGFRDTESIVESALKLYESLPTLLTSAERHLNQAEIDFAERAFAPFWDSVEQAVKALGDYYSNCQAIRTNFEKYKEVSNKYRRDHQGIPPSYALSSTSINKLQVGVSTSKRMNAIVRKAQSDFQFATIFEQRRTNKILIAGFTQLSHALNEMTGEISGAIYGLSSLVGSVSAHSARTQSSIESLLRDHYQESKTAEANRAKREARVIEMLDNIQRNRRPAF